MSPQTVSAMYLMMMQKNTLILLILLVTVANYSNGDVKTSNFDSEKCNKILSKEIVREIDSYQPLIDIIINEAVNGSFRDTTWHELANFVDDFGPRFPGTKNLENSIDYVLERSKELGLENVHGEDVPVPTWIRGKESVTLLSPREKNIAMFGLGYSVGTPVGGIIADAIVVKSFDELKTRADEVPGKIVVYNQEYGDYLETIKYRTDGAIEAAKLGAVAALIRSITPFSIYSPHAGYMNYAENVTKIPAAAITLEDVSLLDRFASRGKQITLKIDMEAHQLPDSISRNVVGEILGNSQPNKVVVVSGHIDSWDVGQGAMDDGGGAFVSWQSLVLLNHLNLRPQRTIRSIMWTATELRAIGAKNYIAQHQNEIKDLQFVIESNTGTFLPLGWEISANEQVICILDRITKLLSSMTPLGVREPHIGIDIQNWIDAGVPGATFWNKDDIYYWYHHTEADTMDIETPENLDMATAVFAATAYILADISLDLPHEIPPK